MAQFNGKIISLKQYYIDAAEFKMLRNLFYTCDLYIVKSMNNGVLNVFFDIYLYTYSNSIVRDVFYTCAFKYVLQVAQCGEHIHLLK